MVAPFGSAGPGGRLSHCLPKVTILGVNAVALGGHLGGLRHPDAWPTAAMNLGNLIERARDQGRICLYLRQGFVAGM
jgi:hypothetical protein